MNNEKIHLAKYIKTYGNYTKSTIKELIEKKKVKVNDSYQPLSYIIKDNDKVYVDDLLLEKVPYVYYLYHKPVGIICTNNINVKGNIISHLNFSNRIFCVGRLDKNTSGLIILTNDGIFANNINNPNKHIEKEYIVTLKEKITNDFLIKIQESIIIRGKETKPINYILIDDYNLKIIICEGKYHQIRKLVSNAKNKVVALKRIRIGNILLDDLEEDKIKEINIKDFNI